MSELIVVETLENLAAVATRYPEGSLQAQIAQRFDPPLESPWAVQVVLLDVEPTQPGWQVEEDDDGDTRCIRLVRDLPRQVRLLVAPVAPLTATEIFQVSAFFNGRSSTIVGFEELTATLQAEGGLVEFTIPAEVGELTELAFSIYIRGINAPGVFGGAQSFADLPAMLDYARQNYAPASVQLPEIDLSTFRPLGPDEGAIATWNEPDIPALIAVFRER